MNEGRMGMRGKKTIALAAVVLVALAALFGIYVWPTRYRYDTMHVGSNIYTTRTNRFTGNSERMTLDGWKAMRAPDILDRLDMSKFQPLAPADPCQKRIPGATEPFTAEDIAGFNLIGATVEQDSGANYLLPRFTTSPNSNKCLTKVEFEIVLGPVGKEYTVHGTLDDAGTPPGMEYGGVGDPVPFPTRHGEQPELISWKVSRAWGYRVPSQ